MAAVIRQRIVTGDSRRDTKQSQNEREDKKSRQNNVSGPAVLFSILVYMLILLYITFQSHWYLPQPNLSTNGQKFSTLNARKHLKALTDIGIRHAGSYQNDILAKDALLSAIEGIKTTASPDVQIDVSVQKPSGHFNLDFIGGLTHLYENLTNVIVRLSRRGSSQDHALLINCHFDSALGSPAASDDAASCSILLEVLRCLSGSHTPLKHSVIFLFNGAEEMLLPASHGFITGHPWAGQVRAFLNLEAAGAGGKEIVFQTGPENPWLAQVYAKVVPYPHASVIAQEIFQSGIILSDTDFRIFRDFGGVPGVDMAFFVNGYIYHTEYDTPDKIPDGSIQRAGENILALIKEIADSDLLVEPGEYKHGKVVYFDVLGLFSIVYSERIGLILNYSTLALTIFGIYIGGKRKQYESQSSYSLIIKSFPIVVVSLVTGIVSAICTGILTTLFNKTLTYYSNQLFAILLYYIPNILGMYTVHYWWKIKNSHLSSDQLERATLHSNQLLLWLLLLLATYCRLASSCLPMILLIFLVVFRTILHDNYLKYKCKRNTAIFILLHLTSLLPLNFIITANIVSLELFIPLMGRAGTIVPSDIIISVLCAILCTQLLFYVIPTIVHYSTPLISKAIITFLTGIWLAALTIAFFGLVRPFSVHGNVVCPKRIYFQHTHVHYHDNTSLSGVYIHALDYRELDSELLQNIPILKDVAEVDCIGIYCGLPSYMPIENYVKRHWMIPGPPPPVQAGQLTLDSIETTSTNSRNYSFTAKLPNNARLHIEPVEGLSVISWSFDPAIPAMTPYGDNKGCYYILYTRGTGSGITRFWIELEGNTGIIPAIEIATIAVYINPPLSSTPLLREMIQSMPEWVSPIAWTSDMTIKKF